MNLLIATGNIGKDAEQKYTAGGDSIVSFSLPVKSGYGDKSKTSWVRCSMFGKRGESVFQYLKKGSLVGVSGEFSMNEWTNKEGQPQSSPECRVSELTLLGGKRDSESTHSQNAANSSKSAPKGSRFDELDGEIPF